LHERKYGFISRKGEVVIPLEFDGPFMRGHSFIPFFFRGLAYVGHGGKNGYINTAGEIIVPLIYDFLWHDGGFEHEDLILVSLNGLYGIVGRDGTVIVQPRYNNIFGFHEGFSRVTLNDKYGFIDRTGREVIPCELDAASFYVSEGLVGVAVRDPTNRELKWGFVSLTNEQIPSPPISPQHEQPSLWAEMHVNQAIEAGLVLQVFQASYTPT
jgi:hypothetical protein